MPDVLGILHINPLTIAVIRKKLDKTAIGKYDFNKQAIYFDSKLVGPPAQVTIGHEIMHAWLDRAGLDLPKKQKEQICDIVGFGLVELLSDRNRGQLNMIMEKAWEGA